MKFLPLKIKKFRDGNLRSVTDLPTRSSPLSGSCNLEAKFKTGLCTVFSDESRIFSRPFGDKKFGDLKFGDGKLLRLGGVFHFLRNSSAFSFGMGPAKALISVGGLNGSMFSFCKKRPHC